MKMTVETFDAKVRDHENKHKRITDDIAELAMKEAALAEELEASADAGDVDLYIKLNRQKEDISAALLVKRTFLDKMGPAVTPDDAKEAWSSYVSGYDKEMKKAISDFEAAKNALISKYETLIDKQWEALNVKDHLNKQVKLPDPDKAYPMLCIPCLSNYNEPGSLNKGAFNIADPDLLYFMANKERISGKSLFKKADEKDADIKKALDAVRVVFRRFAKYI